MPAEQPGGMSDPERFLSSLVGPLSAIQAAVRRITSPETRVDPISGAICIGHRPRIGPEAFALRIFPGAATALIDAYQEIHRVTIPDIYRTLLQQMNGATLFEMDLLGVPPLMAKRPPLIDRSTAWPLDIGTNQMEGRRKFGLSPSDFLIGIGPLPNDEHLGYALWPNGQVEALRPGGGQVSHWNDIQGFLSEELARVEALAPAYERKMIDLMDRHRSSVPWWKKLWPRS
jgi:hypothetical protein